MGWKLSEIPNHFYPLMSQMDREALGRQSSAPDPKLDPHPEPKSGANEGDEQAEFAKWLLQLQDEYNVAWSWHAMHKPSRATPGTPDFWVGVGGGIWIEFKRDYSCELSPHQELFRRRCEQHNCQMQVVYNAGAAKKLVLERLDLATLL